MADPNLNEAMRLWEQYKRQYGGAGSPTRLDTAAQGATALERVIQPALQIPGEVVGGAMHVAGIPARALAAVGTNLAGTGAPVDVSDYALYGRDLETGRTAAHYGDLLAGTLEDTGEVAPGGIASKIIAAAGNMITDPAMAPLLLSGGEAAGALMGRSAPTAGAGGGGGTRPAPRGRLNPAYRTGPGTPGARPAGGGQAFNPSRTQPVGFDPGATQPVEFDPTATQPVRGVAKKPGSMEDQYRRIKKGNKPKEE